MNNLSHETKIRKATINDLDDILELNHELFLYEKQFVGTYNLKWSYSEEGRASFTKRIHNRKGIVLIAEIEDKPIGYISGWYDNYSFRADKVNPLVEVETMYIRDEHRRKGIGTQLLNEFILIAKKQGVKRAIVFVTHNKNIPAINFYRKNKLIDHQISLEGSI
jgi:ribosomal protein S18 acetylase RimI-like enzyme